MSVLQTLVVTPVSGLVPHGPAASMGKNSGHYQGLHTRMLPSLQCYGPVCNVGRTVGYVLPCTRDMLGVCQEGIQHLDETGLCVLTTHANTCFNQCPQLW